jgi:hypothetical protein
VEEIRNTCRILMQEFEGKIAYGEVQEAQWSSESRDQ